MSPLKEKLARYLPDEASASWYARWSGRRLDIYSRYNFSVAPEAFRNSVIDAGYLLKDLEISLNRDGWKIVNHSFPSLDHPQWVLSIGLERLSNPVKNTGPDTESPLPSHPDPIEQLAESALSWSFSFLYLDQDVTDPQATGNPGQQFAYPARAILESKGDNPFVWLLVGQWLRTAESLMKTVNPDHMILAEVRIPDELKETVPEPIRSTQSIDNRSAQGQSIWTPQLLLHIGATEK